MLNIIKNKMTAQQQKHTILYLQYFMKNSQQKFLSTAKFYKFFRQLENKISTWLHNSNTRVTI